ncbi:hypothetical protein [Nocardioides sp. 1609]|uniref:hypothetical protein n=1 Tax=Nocardioides sp. 1609 TaxID=2508327 RepID=UPI00106FEFAE|nr:hypothetical protein [Nocardioides sp. 1609]
MRIPRYKLALLNWVSIYPLITLILWAGRPLTRHVPLYVTTLVASLTLVGLMTFLIMPLMTRTFGSWLTKQSGRDAVPTPTPTPTPLSHDSTEGALAE